MPTQTASKTPPKIEISRAEKCMVATSSDGGAEVTFRIDPQTWARLSRKMGVQDPALFLWENILHRAVEGIAY